MNTPSTLPRNHTYELTRFDLFVGHLIAIRHSRLLIGMLLFLLSYAGVLGLSKAHSRQFPLAVRFATVLTSVVLVLVIFCVGMLVVAAIIAYTRKHKGVLGVHILVLTDDGLIERTDYNDTLHRWKGFHRVRQTSRYLYLYLTETLYHQIPKRSFASDEDQRSFLDEIKRRTNAA